MWNLKIKNKKQIHLNDTEKQISKLEDKVLEITDAEQKKEKKNEKK